LGACLACWVERICLNVQSCLGGYLSCPTYRCVRGRIVCSNEEGGRRKKPRVSRYRWTIELNPRAIRLVSNTAKTEKRKNKRKEPKTRNSNPVGYSQDRSNPSLNQNSYHIISNVTSPSPTAAITQTHSHTHPSFKPPFYDSARGVLVKTVSASLVSSSRTHSGH
jgi:hypothetical protein